MYISKCYHYQSTYELQMHSPFIQISIKLGFRTTLIKHMVNTQIWSFVWNDVIEWKHFPRYWPFVRGIPGHRWIPLTKEQWRGPLMFSLISTRTNVSVNNRDAGDLRRHRTHCDVTVMIPHGYNLYESSKFWTISIISKKPHKIGIVC